MTVATYLSQEGFEEQKKGVFVSKEIVTTITSTMNPKLWDVTVNGFTYREILDGDVSKAIDAIHKFTDTSLVVALYNMQRSVIMKRVLPIKEVF